MKKLTKALFAFLFLSLTTIAIAGTNHLSSINRNTSKRSFILCQSKNVISPYFPVHSFDYYSLGWDATTETNYVTLTFWEGGDPSGTISPAPVNIVVVTSVNSTNFTDTILRRHSQAQFYYSGASTANIYLVSVTPNTYGGLPIYMAQ